MLYYEYRTRVDIQLEGGDVSCCGEYSHGELPGRTVYLAQLFLFYRHAALY
jgi:hypothetical protein